MALCSMSSCTCLAFGMSIHGQIGTATSASTGMRSFQVRQLASRLGWVQGILRDRGLRPGLELSFLPPLEESIPHIACPFLTRQVGFMPLWYLKVVLWVSVVVPKEGHQPFALCLPLLWGWSGEKGNTCPRDGALEVTE